MANGNAAYELEKMEYEQAATRYQNIYQSAWSNFSYLTAVTAGIIAFGSKTFPNYVTLALSTLPLLFWFWAVFEPANKYGDKVSLRLSDIETALSNKYSVELKHFQQFQGRKGRFRVRYIVRLVAGALHLSLILLLIYKPQLAGATKADAVTISQTGGPLAVHVVKGDETQKLSQENEQLRGALETMRRSLDSISADLKDIKARQK